VVLERVPPPPLLPLHPLLVETVPPPPPPSQPPPLAALLRKSHLYPLPLPSLSLVEVELKLPLPLALLVVAIVLFPLLLPLLLRLVRVEVKLPPSPSPLLRLAPALVERSLITAEFPSHSHCSRTPIHSAERLVKLKQDQPSSLPARRGKLHMESFVISPRLTSYNRNWFKTPAGWAKKQHKPVGCGKSFHRFAALCQNELMLIFLKPDQLSSAKCGTQLIANAIKEHSMMLLLSVFDELKVVAG
jgi:hypothetical protein